MSYYSLEQIYQELIRLGKPAEKRPSEISEGNFSYSWSSRDQMTAESKLKGRANKPARCDFIHVLKDGRTPWGKPQDVYMLTEGLYFVSTARHGGLWLSDEWIAKLPKSYKSFVGNRRWAEEDCDCAEVLQYFGLLSLVSEPMELQVTTEDIEKGRQSRQTWRGEDWWTRPRFGIYSDMDGHYGGPISEAYCRVTGHTESLINTQRCLQMRPGIWRFCSMPKEAAVFLKAFDADEQVQPITITLEPYIFTNFNSKR